MVQNKESISFCLKLRPIFLLLARKTAYGFGQPETISFVVPSFSTLPLISITEPQTQESLYQK